MNKYQLLLVPVFNEKENRFAKGWKMFCLRMEQNLLNDGEKKLTAKYFQNLEKIQNKWNLL